MLIGNQIEKQLTIFDIAINSQVEKIGIMQEL